MQRSSSHIRKNRNVRRSGCLPLTWMTPDNRSARRSPTPRSITVCPGFIPGFIPPLVMPTRVLRLCCLFVYQLRVGVLSFLSPSGQYPLGLGELLFSASPSPSKCTPAYRRIFDNVSRSRSATGRWYSQSSDSHASSPETPLT